MDKSVFYFKSICISLSLLVVAAASSAQEVIPVEQAVDRALKNNLQIRQAEFQHALSEQDLKQSKLDYYPTLNANVNGRRNWGLFFNTDVGALSTQAVSNLGAGVNANVSLFQGFRRVHQIAANRHQMIADATDIDRAKNDLILSVVTKYLEAIVNMDMWTAAQQQLVVSKNQLEVANINFEAGLTTLADLSQAKSQVSIDELNVISNLNAYDLALLELKQLMEMDPADDIELVKPDLPAIEQSGQQVYVGTDLYQEAVQRYPEVKVAEERTLVAKRNIDVAKSAFYPTLDIGANLNTAYSSAIPDVELQLPLMSFQRQMERNFAQAVFFNLSIPIFNRFDASTNVTRAKINYQNALTAEQLTKNNLNKIIHQAVMDLRAADQRYYSTQMAFNSAKDAFDVIQQRFDVGMANSIELITSQTNMNNAEFEHIQAKYDLIFRSKVIDFYLGKQVIF